jgi:SsrA-binding protein
MTAHKDGSPRLTEVRNSKVFRDYEVGDRFEAGIELLGTEVKSIRSGRAQISDAFCKVERGEVWMHNAHIDPYAFGAGENHDARRVRKLFLHRSDIRKIDLALNAGGQALVPLRLYFKQALVKVEVALGTGKKRFDKREDLKKKAQMREVNRALRSRRA